MQQGPVRINDELSVAGQIAKEDIAALAKEGFATIINNRPDDEEPGQLTMTAAKAEAERLGLQYLYQPVTTATITKADVTAFQNAMLRAPKPILAHCRSGTRCYLLWGLSRALFEDESPLQIAAHAARQGFDLRILPALVDKLRGEN
jgi:uncharacterized protein (TIGR01244 family)